MIDFACKTFDLDEVIKCSLGLNKSEFKILKFFIKKSKNFTTEELSVNLRLDKSTIQRGVKKLHEKGILSRGQMNKSRGGYVFFYKLKDKSKTRNLILRTVDDWVKIFHRKINEW